MASAPRPMKRSTYGRCKLCDFVFPGGWFRIPNVPNSAMLLHHLGNDHLVEAKPYLVRMETQEIDEVVMELFERVEDPD
jgi:hypothetical protein